MVKRAWLAAACAIPALAQAQAPAAAPDWPAFVVDHFARGDSPADARFLLDAPAGKHGFVHARDGHLFFDDGTRLKCWGVNLTGWTPGSAEIPDHDAAKVFAAELARLGINCVRLHFLDMPDQTVARGDTEPSGDPGPVTHRPVGLIDSTQNDTQHFNAQQLDNFDFWFAELKRQGIYADFNLNVGHSWKEGDGVPDAKLIGVAKGYTYFGPELIARQKDYARMLLGHRNAYTGLRYADDPAVSTVEMVNENSLLEFWMRNWLRGDLGTGATTHQLDLTPHYLALLTNRYTTWLAAHRTPEEVATIRREAGVAAGAPVPIMRRQDFDAASPLRLTAEVDFLTSVERGFFDDMAGFLRRDVGVKAPIVATADHSFFIPGMPLLRTTQHYDILDAHVYWQHPAIYGARNTAMVDDPEHSIIQKLSRTAMAGKPFTVSEVNEPVPGEYDAEQIPMLAAYAALQDWDGVFFYTFESKLRDGWQGMMGDHFDMTQHPGKIAQLPAGAMIFLRGDVTAARRTVTRSYSTAQINEMPRMKMSALPAFDPAFPARLPLVSGSRIKCLDCAPFTAVAPPDGDPIVSDTGELRWHSGAAGSGTFTIDTARSQALVGFVAKNAAATANLSVDISTPFAAVTLSALDGKPIAASNRLLLTTAARVANTGAIWNARRTAYANWGGAPTRIEPVKGWVQLHDLVGAVDVTVTPLDGAARPMTPYKARLIETGWEFAIGAPATTSYVVTVDR